MKCLDFCTSLLIQYNLMKLFPHWTYRDRLNLCSRPWSFAFDSKQSPIPFEVQAVFSCQQLQRAYIHMCVYIYTWQPPSESPPPSEKRPHRLPGTTLEIHWVATAPLFLSSTRLILGGYIGSRVSLCGKPCMSSCKPSPFLWRLIPRWNT